MWKTLDTHLPKGCSVTPVCCDAQDHAGGSTRWCSCPRVAWDKTTTWLLSLTHGSQLAENNAVMETQIPNATHCLSYLEEKAKPRLLDFKALSPALPNTSPSFPTPTLVAQENLPLYASKPFVIVLGLVSETDLSKSSKPPLTPQRARESTA